MISPQRSAAQPPNIEAEVIRLSVHESEWGLHSPALCSC